MSVIKLKKEKLTTLEGVSRVLHKAFCGDFPSDIISRGRYLPQSLESSIHFEGLSQMPHSFITNIILL